jgi:hypothetical protein
VTTQRLRCRAIRRNPTSLIHQSQCQHPAKGKTVMDGKIVDGITLGGQPVLLPACGHHLQPSHYVISSYRQQSEKYESPIREYMS